MKQQFACVNCGQPVRGRAGSAYRGRDTAWFVHCPPCADLAARQVEPTDLAPADSGIVIHRCRRCATLRVCRASWRTRCHVCLDERSAGLALAAGERLLAGLPGDPALAVEVRAFAALAPDEPVPVRVAAEFVAAHALAAALERHDREGWTVLAGDVHGLPWYGERRQAASHGTWGVHDDCGTVQKLSSARCASCSPGPGGRSFEALRDTPCLLYLVRHRGVLKFGVGGDRRVRTHVTAGAVVVQVLQGRHADVIAAEANLKRHKREAGVPLRFWHTWRMPASFGAGTEVVRAATPVDLARVLPAGVDVTRRFAGR
jgi:hypothetical protein